MFAKHYANPSPFSILVCFILHLFHTQKDLFEHFALWTKSTSNRIRSQRYKGLKRKAKSADSTDSNDTLSTSPAKSKTAGKQGAANSARSKKRTADTARAEEDAVEEDDAGPSTKKVKREGEGVNGEVFKVEAGEGGVNVEDDAEYVICCLF